MTCDYHNREKTLNTAEKREAEKATPQHKARKMGQKDQVVTTVRGL